MNCYYMDAGQLIYLYTIKRIFVAIDEWLFYAVLIYLYMNQFPLYITMTVLLFGIGAIITNYKNLAIVEAKLGINGWFYYPMKDSIGL